MGKVTKKMRIILIQEKETEKIKSLLKEQDRVHIITISSEYGEYKKGEFVKTNWGQRLVVTDIIQPRNFEDFKKQCSHYQELKETNFQEIKPLFTHKKIEIIELRKYK